MATELALIGVSVACVCLSGGGFFLLRALVRTNQQLIAFNSKTLEHALAFSDEQRDYLRIDRDSVREEILAREAKEAAAIRRGMPPRASPQNNGALSTSTHPNE